MAAKTIYTCDMCEGSIEGPMYRMAIMEDGVVGSGSTLCFTAKLQKRHVCSDCAQDVKVYAESLGKNRRIAREEVEAASG